MSPVGTIKKAPERVLFYDLTAAQIFLTVRLKADTELKLVKKMRQIEE